MTIERDGAFNKYGPEDFTPGHRDTCSFQLGEPTNCPVCGPAELPMTDNSMSDDVVERAKGLLAIWDAAPAGPITKQQHDAYASLRNMGPELARILAAMPQQPVVNQGEVERLARALVAKLDECDPHIAGAFAFMQNHGGSYSGPQYGEELEALRAALSSTNTPLDRPNE